MIFTEVRLYNGLSVHPDKTYTSEQEPGRPVIPVGAVPDEETGTFARKERTIVTYSNVVPRKGNELRCVELPISMELCSPLTGPTLSVPRYITLRTEVGMVIYGWVDRCEPIAEKGPAHNTRIWWHVDWWMIYEHWNHVDGSPYAVLTSARIKRGPVYLARPEPSDPRIWRYYTGERLMQTGDNNRYAVVLITQKEQDPDRTVFKILSWQTTVTSGPPYHLDEFDIYNGNTEEFLGLDPESIVGVWFSPIRPFAFTDGRRKENDWHGIRYEYWWQYAGISGHRSESTHVMTDMLTVHKTKDYDKWILVDPIGTTYATLGWGVEWRYLDMCVDVGPSGAYLIVNFLDNPIGATSIAEGRTVQMPLVAAPVTSNAFSSYVYSGQRDYDMRMAEIQRNTQAQNGVMGIGTTALSGAMMGSLVPGIGTAAGAAAGVVTGAVSAIGGYFIQGETDKKSQAATDRLAADQTSSVLISSGGQAWRNNILTGGWWWLVNLRADDDSADSLEAEHKKLGYVTDYYTDTLDAKIRTYGGPFRAEGVEMTGQFPNEGRQYLVQLLGRGVIFDKFT